MIKYKQKIYSNWKQACAEYEVCYKEFSSYKVEHSVESETALNVLIMNKYGKIPAVSSVFVCVVNGMTFRSQKAACKHYEVTVHKVNRTRKKYNFNFEDAINYVLKNPSKTMPIKVYEPSNDGADYYLYRFPVTKLVAA